MADAPLADAPAVTPFAAVWPSRTWTPAEKTTAAMMNSIRDQLNELHATSAAAVTTTLATGGAVQLPAGPVQVVFFTNTTPITVSSVTPAGGAQIGDRLFLVSTGSGNVALTYGQGAGLLFNHVASGPTMLLAAKGSATYVCDGGGAWRLVTHMQGGYIPFTPVFNAAWTVPPANTYAAYELVGTTLHLLIYGNGSYNGPYAVVTVTLPNGYLGAPSVNVNYQTVRAGVTVNAVATVFWGMANPTPNSGIVNFWTTPSGGGWSGADPFCYVQGLVEVPLT